MWPAETTKVPGEEWQRSRIIESEGVPLTNTTNKRQKRLIRLGMNAIN